MPRKTMRRPRRTKAKPLNQTEKSQVKTIVKRQLNSRLEWKHHDVNTTFTSGYNGDIYNLSNIDQGDTGSLRDGDAVYATSLQCRYQIVNADATNLQRLIIFQWNGEDSPAVSDILATVGTTRAPLSPYEADKVGRNKLARVLYDRTFNLQEPFSGGSHQIIGSFKVSLKKRHIQFQDGTTTGANKVFLLSVSDSSIVSHPIMNVYTRLWFQDA